MFLIIVFLRTVLYMCFSVLVLLCSSAFLVRILGDVHFGSGLVRFNLRLVFAADMNSYIIKCTRNKTPSLITQLSIF